MERIKFWDFEIQTIQQIPANCKEEKNLSSNGFCYSSGSKGENQRKRTDKQILGSCQRAEKVVEHKGDGNTSSSWSTKNGPQGLGKKTGGISVQKKNRDHPNQSIVKN